MECSRQHKSILTSFQLIYTYLVALLQTPHRFRTKRQLWCAPFQPRGVWQFSRLYSYPPIVDPCAFGNAA